MFVGFRRLGSYLKPALLAVLTINCKFSCNVFIWLKVSASRFSNRSALISDNFLGRSDNTPLRMGILTLANLSGMLQMEGGPNLVS